MRLRKRSGRILLGATLALALASTHAQASDVRPPDWKGRWIRIGAGNFDPSKPAGLGQQAPLTPEYQAIFAASVADQAAGGQGNDPMARCIPPGMPRMMIVYGLGMEFVITGDTTYILFGEPMNQLRRIYTDGRAWPARIVPTLSGYSIGHWEAGDAGAPVLLAETRGMRDPRSYDSSGMPFHADGQTVVFERIYLDSAKPNIMYDEMTVLDHALTRPWSVKRTYRREPHPVFLETICGEDEHQVKIGGDDYFISGDGFLMPAKKNQAPPDLRNFDQTKK